MADRLLPAVFGFSGGYATDLPTQSRSLDYWLKAENVIFTVSGIARKVGGANKVNATTITDSPDVTGMFDFWRNGAAASFTQKHVVVTANGKVYKDDMDGTYDDITGAATITADAIPVFCQARDLLLIFTDKNDTPLKWNQTGNVASLGGSPPSGRGAVFHNNRVWTWGDNSNPSRLTYGSSTTAEDFTGVDTGGIDIDPEDGDRIVGAISHKEILFIFKGPNTGSIHMIAGTAPTGGDAYSRKVLVRGIALQTHNSIIPVGDDVFFMSERGIHSLRATQQFGNFSEADVTRYLKGYFRDNLNRAQLNKVWGVNYADKGCMLWLVPLAGSTECNAVFGLSYIRSAEEGPKAFTWTRAGTSAGIRIHPTTKARELVFGTTDGFVTIQDYVNRSIYSNTAYQMTMRSPQILMGGADGGGRQRPDQPITIERIYMRSVSTGNHNVSMLVSRLTPEGQTESETYTFNQGESLFVLGTSQLNVGTLGGDSVPIIYSTPSAFGSARAVQFEITQGGLNQDAQLLEFGVEYTPQSQANTY